jgi:hexosaminidase
MNRLKLFLIFLLMMFCGAVDAQKSTIIPQPNKVDLGVGKFVFKNGMSISMDKQNKGLILAVEPLLQKLKTAAGINLKVSDGPDTGNIQVQLSDKIQHPQGYLLDVNSSTIKIQANNAVGVFNAVQTILQLLPHQIESNKKVDNFSWQIPVVKIDDEPAFQYRGLMIDVARHFLPVPFLKKLIDLMSMQKMNNLHLHLTDDQGWRIEIKKYPKLTAVGGFRNGTIKGKYPGTGSDNATYGGFYTQDELRDLIDYAGKKFIEIVPEIEMPGHASAAIAAYPELSCFPLEPTDTLPNMMAKKSLETIVNKKGKVVQETWGVFQDVFAPTEYTFNFLQDVLDEVIDLFPSKFIHVGGDECPKEFWKRSSFCQNLIKENNLKDEHGLQSYFIQRIEKYINTKGRNIIGWDEILEGGLAPNATVMSWRGIAGGIEAAKQGHDAIMSPVDFCYLNLYQSEDPTDSIAWGGLIKLKSVYGYQPIPAALNAEQAKHIIGVQGNLWTEYLGTPALAEYMLFPRAIALAEVGWTKSRPAFTDFTNRLIPFLSRYALKKVNYSKHIYDIAIKGKLDQQKKAMEITVEGVPNQENVFYALTSKGVETALKPYLGPVQITSPARMTVQVKMKGELVDRATADFTVNKATGQSVVLEKEPAAQYSKGGSAALVNGILGSDGRFNDNEWLGWNGDDFVGTVSWEKKTSIKKVGLRFFNAPSSWIYLPAQVELLGSLDGVTYKVLGIKKDFDPKKSGNQRVEFVVNTEEVKYIKIRAKNFGLIPKGENGAGNPSWLFVDEIEVD